MREKQQIIQSTHFTTVDISRIIELKSNRTTCTVDKVDSSTTARLTNEFAVDISKCNTVLLGSYSVCIVLKGSGNVKFLTIILS